MPKAKPLTYVAEPCPKRHAPERPALCYPAHMVPHLRGALPDHEREHLVLLCLDRRGALISVQVLTTGTDACTIIDPRQILVAALRANATGIVIAHNHPSGTPEASSQDIEATRRVRAACVVVGVTCLDHIILTADADVWTSLAARGHLC